MDNFREWVSDNLRYIMLAVGILAALIGIFFGVRALSGLTRGSSGNTDSITSSVTAASSISVPDMSTPAVASSAESAAEEPGGPLLENAVAEVTDLVNRYYSALNSRDTAAAAQCVDVMTDSLSSDIAESAATYSDIRVYTKTGLVPDSYVVFVYYHYLNEGDSTALAGLSQMLVRKGADGTFRIVFSDLDQATSDYIDRVAAEDDVKALVDSVTNEYNAGVTAASEAAKAAAQAEESSSEAQPEENPAAVTDEGSAAEAEAAETTDAEPAAEETPAQDPSGEDGTRITTILRDCFIRSAPGYNGQVLRTIKAGTEVTVIGDISKGWWHIVANDDGTEGYVGRTFIQ